MHIHTMNPCTNQAPEDDEEWKHDPVVHSKKIRVEISPSESKAKLEELLARASLYTQFLQKQLDDIGEGAQSEER